MRREEFRVSDLVLSALLLGIGFILHGIFPGIFAGMKPDFSLMMLFVIVMLIPDRRIAFLAGIATGIITALTTTFPAGQIPNLVDKLVTTGAVVLLSQVLPGRVRVPVVGIVGTLISGAVFLGTAVVVAGLPAPFSALMASVVIPAAAVNTAALLVIYPVVSKLYLMQSQRAKRVARVTEA